MIPSGCRIGLRKTHFGYKELKYLGHKLNGITIALDDGRTLAIKDWAKPKTVKQLQSFLGFTGYHRSFIPHYAQIVRPLQILVPKDTSYIWGKEQDAAFEAVKNALIEAVKLTKPDFDKPFVVYTDASAAGLGAGLYQNFVGKERPIAFISRQLRGAEERYGATQLEALAVIWMLEKFHYYLDGAHFKIVTDCVALRSLLTAKVVHRQMIRWQAAIQEYRGNMTILPLSWKTQWQR